MAEFGDPNLAKPHRDVMHPPLPGEAGKGLGTLHLVNDVSQRPRSEFELRVM